ncbi:globin [Marinobacter lacisalsi]|uniref:Globin n=1 Tax=Marinobacter lacisalsi TaxID=475979 RepID=A0ABV8QMK7_9GAMM
MNPTDNVFQSYGRCCRDEQFFINFYTFFMDSSEQIRERFANTDMAAQRHLLRNGIMQLILTARGMSDRKLRALGESHDRHHYNIDPAWYELWLTALMKAVRHHDPEYSPALEEEWHEVLRPGIDLIRGAY